MLKSINARELFFLYDLTIRHLKRFSGINLSANFETSDIIHFSSIIKIYYIIKRRILNMPRFSNSPRSFFENKSFLHSSNYIPTCALKTLFTILKITIQYYRYQLSTSYDNIKHHILRIKDTIINSFEINSSKSKSSKMILFIALT